MIKRALRNIRQKPKAVREQYAFWIACTLTSVVALVWILTTFGQAEDASQPPKPQETVTPESGGISDFIDNTRAQINAAQEELQAVLPADETISRATSTNQTLPATTTQTENQVSTPVAVDQRPVRIATTSAASTSNQTAAE